MVDCIYDIYSYPRLGKRNPYWHASIILMDVAEFRMSVTFRPSNEEEACEYSIHESTSPYIYISLRTVSTIRQLMLYIEGQIAGTA